MYVLLTDFRFVGPTDERYVTGGVGPVWDFVTGGVKIGQKKRYVIVERPLGLAFCRQKPIFARTVVKTGFYRFLPFFSKIILNFI